MLKDKRCHIARSMITDVHTIQLCKHNLHNWSLQPITYVVSINFIHEWRDLQFKVDFERQIF